ncbi:MAG: dTDP-4-dehydrorhamnose reductase [Bacteroidales bacterium]|nr:dTDP-4-dehydrorhamnose reductase [Bacteroidales bacterium]
MNVLFTGANGQLGNELRLLFSNGADNCLFTDISAQEGVQTEILDIADAEAVRRTVEKHKTDLIINCAAYNNVDKAEEDEQAAMLLNAQAPGILAREAARAGASLIHVSTDYVFPGTANRPIDESAEPAPVSVYGRSKLAGEDAVRSSGCRYVILRTAWLYSPFGKNFVKTIRSLAATRSSLNVVFDQVGSPTSAYDLARAIQAVAKSKNGWNATYHYSGEGAVSWFDFASAIVELSGLDCRVNACLSSEFPAKAQRPAYSVLDKSLIKQTFGLEVPWWRTSLEKCIVRL